MVNTRSNVRRERDQMDLNKKETPETTQNNGESSQPFANQSEHDAQNFETLAEAFKMAGTSVKSEIPLQPPTRYATPRSISSKKSSSSSVIARKKKLELEAAKQRAKIQMELIDKQLEADIAELKDEELYSPHHDDNSTKDVEQWLEKSYQQVGRLTPERDIQMGEPRSSAPPQGQAPAPELKGARETGDTVHLLAKALKDMAAASVTKEPNRNLLSRLCTPRDLPEYTGEPMEWLQFKEAYNESTDVCKFSPKENMWRLRKCLKGAAKDAVSALLMSATSPDKIMSTLELRFGNPDLIISKILQDVNKLQPLPNDYHKDIVTFSVKVQNLIEAIRSLKREEYLQGMSVASVVVSKLPAILLSKWSDYSFPLITKGKKSRLIILSDFLHEEALKISTTSNVHFLTQRNDQHNRFRQSEYNNNRSHTMLVQSDSDNNDNCNFCRKSKHCLPECKMFKKALRKARWNYVKRLGVCYKCLSSRHNRETCTAPACDADGCGQPHHKLLHYPVLNRENTVTRPQPTAVSSISENVNHIGASDIKSVLLKVVPIRIHGPNGVINTNALLDDGSTISLISDELAGRAGLRGRRQTMRVSGAWTDNELVCEATVMNINISGMDSSSIYKITMHSVNELNLPIQRLSVLNCKSFNHLEDIKLNYCMRDCKPELLIGQDNYHLLLPLEVKSGKSNEPYATLTHLGWCIHGTLPVSRGATRTSKSVCLTHAVAGSTGTDDVDSTYLLQNIHDEVRRSFALDSLGISGKPRQNGNEVRAVAQLHQTAELVDGRWYVGLPWKNDSCKMPDTFSSALKRFLSIENKMSKNKGFAQRYADRINHLLLNDYAQELKDTTSSDKTWYLPHFGVDNPYKNKLRLVFDGASKVDGSCLNDYLLTGPDLLSSLYGIMLRFRINAIAVTGDIKDMFLRIKIREKDQHALRFLWRDNPNEPIKTYVMTSLIFGANCSPFVAQFVKNLNAAQYESSYPAAAEAIKHSHYMDDYIQSLPNESLAIEMVQNVVYIHKKGGFEIRNWTSNSLAVLESVSKDTLGSAAIRFKIAGQNEGERTLGLIWYPGTDELGFDVSLKRIPDNVLSKKERPTKRLMLRVIMSVFDIFGFLTPFTIQGRIMLQDTWRLNIGWDDGIPDSIYSKWCTWLDLLKTVNKVRVARYYRNAAGTSDTVKLNSSNCENADVHHCRRSCAKNPSTAPHVLHNATMTSAHATTHGYETTTEKSTATASIYDNLQLHIFSDASAKAMCAVAYWRWVDNGQTRVALIGGKCRVMPVKPLTMPRAELQAAVLAARFMDSIIREHKLTVTRRVLWCDSTTVLHWIRNNTRTYKTFEANRLGEVDELTSINEWRYIPTKMNIADLATREVFDKSVFKNEWFSGPKFLYDIEHNWPVDVIQPLISEVNTACVTVKENSPADLPVPDPGRFSSWLRLMRATATVLVFVDRCKKGTASIDCNTMAKAERMLIKYAQNASFAEEIAAISNGRPIKRTSRLITLTPYLDECRLLRAGGRIDAAANVNLETKRPIILDGRHPVARLIVRYYHVRMAHGNQETIVNDLKQKYWIVKLRSAVKSVAYECMYCRMRKAKPQMPMMGDLPAARMAHHNRPFSFCGLDLFGPMEVAVGRRREKRYGVLFTCLTVRAVHLELVASLSTDSLIMALRRMAARRGWPKHLYSDNGTNLRGADNELQRSLNALDAEILKKEGVNNDMEWHFIPPASPHWGGAWERLIRSVKTSLQVVLNERAPKEEILITFLAEVENIVNSRPLGHVSVEPGSTETLTPNHFLLGASCILPAIGAFDDEDLCLRKQWRKAQRLADMYWARWVKEILPEMLPRRKWNEEQRSLKVGDCVFVVDPSSPRNVWPKGIIQRVYPGKDQRVRLVDVKTKSGVLRRSASRVAPFPLNDECCASTRGGSVSDALTS